jgi:hypothetical protein
MADERVTFPGTKAPITSTTVDVEYLRKLALWQNERADERHRSLTNLLLFLPILWAIIWLVMAFILSAVGLGIFGLRR